MHATLQQLRLFEAVARLGNVTRAAEEVHLTQPAVSSQLKRLEEQAGLPLLETVGRRLQPTTAGQAVMTVARDMLERLADLDEALETLRGEIAGPVKVSVVTSAKYFLPHLLGTFVRRHPRVEPVLSVTNRLKILGRLRDHQDDIYVMGQVPEDLAVDATPFLDNPLVVVAPPDHLLAGDSDIPLAALARERFLVREAGSGTRLAVERLFADHGLAVRPFMELGSGEAIKQGVMAGLGLAVLSRHALALEIATGRLAVLDVEGFPLHRTWYAVRPRGRHLTLAARTFLDFMCAEGAAVIGAEPGAADTWDALGASAAE